MLSTPGADFTEKMSTSCRLLAKSELLRLCKQPVGSLPVTDLIAPLAAVSAAEKRLAAAELAPGGLSPKKSDRCERGVSSVAC